MGLYERYCLPRLIQLACGASNVRKQREKVVPLAKGTVLEIGMGPGLNIPHYDGSQVDMVWGLEPSAAMRKRAKANLSKGSFEVQWLDLPGEEIPLDDNSVDTVLLTYTLCTIPDWKTALQQMRRVLKPGANLVFCEHGEAPDESVRKWQRRLNPIWGKIGGGCQLNRPIPRLLEEGGFRIDTLDSMYIPGPRFASFNYWGTATAAS